LNLFGIKFKYVDIIFNLFYILYINNAPKASETILFFTLFTWLKRDQENYIIATHYYLQVALPFSSLSWHPQCPRIIESFVFFLNFKMLLVCFNWGTVLVLGWLYVMSCCLMVGKKVTIEMSNNVEWCRHG
jgi:hypothetical protein